MHKRSPSEKPIYVFFKEYLARQNITNKYIAEEFGYSEAMISQYLSGKAKETNRLDKIALMFLRLKEYDQGMLSKEEVDDVLASNEILRSKCARYEGEINTLKNLLKIQKEERKTSSKDITLKIESIVAKSLKKHGIKT